MRQIESMLIEHNATPTEIEQTLAYWRAEYANDRLRIVLQTWRELWAWAREGYPPQDPTAPPQLSVLS